MNMIQLHVSTEDVQMLYDAVDILNPDTDAGQDEKYYLLDMLAQTLAKISPEVQP